MFVDDDNNDDDDEEKKKKFVCAHFALMCELFFKHPFNHYIFICMVTTCWTDFHFVLSFCRVYDFWMTVREREKENLYDKPH